MRHRLSIEALLDGRVLIHQGGDHIELVDQHEVDFVMSCLQHVKDGQAGITEYEKPVTYAEQVSESVKFWNEQIASLNRIPSDLLESANDRTFTDDGVNVASLT